VIVLDRRVSEVNWQDVLRIHVRVGGNTKRIAVGYGSARVSKRRNRSQGISTPIVRFMNAATGKEAYARTRRITYVSYDGKATLKDVCEKWLIG
jgi:hypothetical protein